MDPEFVELAKQLFLLYLAIGATVCGFAYMFGGPSYAKPVAHWFYVQPVKFLIHKLWETFVSVVYWMVGYKPKKKKKKK